MAGPTLPDISTLIQAGIDPKTKLPIKLSSSIKGTSKEDIKKALRIVDEQDAVNRYTWYNIPANLTSQELERLLYYKGQLAFFYLEETDEFYFMPYALDGTIDFYGRFNFVHPIPFAFGEDNPDDKNAKKIAKSQRELLSQIKLRCIYSIMEEDEVNWETYTKSCVLIHDYTKQLSQNIIPRCIINDPVLDVESECIPYMQTALLMATGVKGLGVNDANQAEQAEIAGRSIKKSALTCTPYVAIVKGSLDIQELNNGNVANASEYLMSMQAIDNFRLSLYGLENGGLFEKKQHQLQSENDMNANKTSRVYNDGLAIRQNFCNIVNSIWGTKMWCDEGESDEEAEDIDYNDEEVLEKEGDIENVYNE